MNLMERENLCLEQCGTAIHCPLAPNSECGGLRCAHHNPVTGECYHVEAANAQVQAATALTNLASETPCSGDFHTKALPTQLHRRMDSLASAVARIEADAPDVILEDECINRLFQAAKDLLCQAAKDLLRQTAQEFDWSWR